MGISVKLDGLG